MLNSRRRLAVVTPIFSEQISGGSEKLIYQYTLMLSKFYEVTVLATRSLDYITWKNQVPVKSLEPVLLGKDLEKKVSQEWIDTENEDRIRVLRFSVEKERNIRKFNQYSDKLFRSFEYAQAGKSKFGAQLDKERIWIDMQGPYCPELIQYIETNERDYDVFVFVSYLYYPMVYGLPLVAKKAVVIPTLHDEPPARLSVYSNLFKDDSAYCFNTPEEKDLFHKLYGYNPSLGSVIGMHLPIPEMKKEPSPKNTQDSFDFLYVGRIDEGKGVLEMAEYFSEWQKKSGRNDVLTLIGKGDDKLLQRISKFPHIKPLGFVSEKEKDDQIASADILINPSPMESFSIILMEAWIRLKAVLVNGRSDVLKGHCLRSNGGLYYSDQDSFSAIADYLVSHRKEREEMGTNGKKYVQSNFNPEVVEKKLVRIVERCIRRRYSE
ncbi:glycosyltransferase [Leptospira semungkisensis]|uniref:Glycosyltransferase n=1 Tax=Leptospira semungkisensis TaxID=2484985 RepID=A0A4R9G5Y0_9LEPT|nr:glycosyltransferase family 4 protein [Leptospira semungkisensis]TGK06998.1 glycosyltransferase [Leptospira semungkisensis]